MGKNQYFIQLYARNSVHFKREEEVYMTLQNTYEPKDHLLYKAIFSTISDMRLFQI